MNNSSALDLPFEEEMTAIRVRQPIGDFYIASIPARTLIEITLADVRRLSGEKREVETYLGIQRPLNPDRVDEIQGYVNTFDACFPTAIIIAVEGRCATFDEATQKLTLKSVPLSDTDEGVQGIKIARVLDGQHRIEGLKAFNGEVFELNVSVFVDMDIESQAYLFSTVNLAQTKVNRSLVYDLFEYAKARSPQKTAHNIAVALDQTEASPLFHRIKRLGIATANREGGETITQAAFVEALLDYLTDDKIRDRDLFLKHKTPPRATGRLKEKLFLRDMFLDGRDLEIGDIVLNYFQAVKGRWTEAWKSNEPGTMLPRTNGFRALMRLLRPIYKRISVSGGVPTVEEFGRVFASINLGNEAFTVDNFRPGGSGEADLYNLLAAQLKMGPHER